MQDDYHRYDEYEMKLDPVIFNPQMIRVAERDHMHGDMEKRMLLMRYLFDEDEELYEGCGTPVTK